MSARHKSYSKAIYILNMLYDLRNHSCLWHNWYRISCAPKFNSVNGWFKFPTLIISNNKAIIRWMRGEHSIMGVRGSQIEHYFTQQPDYISTATFMEERMRMKKREALKI